MIFPLERLIELEREEVIGRVAETHYSFSYVNDIVTLLTESVPQLLQQAEGGRGRHPPFGPGLTQVPSDRRSDPARCGGIRFLHDLHGERTRAHGEDQAAARAAGQVRAGQHVRGTRECGTPAAHRPGYLGGPEDDGRSGHHPRVALPVATLRSQIKMSPNSQFLMLMDIGGAKQNQD